MNLNSVKIFTTVVIIGFFVLNTLSTPFWRITHDAALIHYIAFLIDEFGYVPYLDIFDTATPATLLIHIVIGKLFGYTEGALQFVNFLLIMSMFAMNFFYFKEI